MSLRLNKIGNIPEVLPTTSGAGWCHYNENDEMAYIQSDSVMYPFAAESIVGKNFRSFNVPNIGHSGAVVNFAGEGAYRFRADKGDYFLAGMILDQLFDDDRALTTPSLIGIVASMWSQVGATTALPTILPMILWSNTVPPVMTSTALSVVHAYCILSPTFENRVIAGKMATFCKVDGTFAIEKRGYKHVYFGWYMGRPSPNEKSGRYDFTTVGSTLSVNSLKGNRPVFDPVMV